MIKLFLMLIPLLGKIFEEYFSYRARKRKEDETFEIDQEKFLEVIQSAINKMRESARKESNQADRIEDAIDKIKQKDS